METKKEEKTIYSLELHKTLFIQEEMGPGVYKRYEVTRVPGGWVYAFEYPVMGGVDTKLTFVPWIGKGKEKDNKINS